MLLIVVTVGANVVDVTVDCGFSSQLGGAVVGSSVVSVGA